MALYPPLNRAEPAPELVALSTVDARTARAAVEREVLESVFRPGDIQRASIGEPAFVYAPFWRVTLSVEGFHLGVALRTTNGGRTMPIPTGGARRASGTIMVCARTIVPYAPRLPIALGRLSTSPALEVDLSELVSIASAADTLADRERVDADVGREQAERIATGMILQQVQPTSALYAKYEPCIESAVALYYPLYVVSYSYDGHARRHPGEEFFVMISGRTGKVVASKHPSALRAVTAKLRRILSFDT